MRVFSNPARASLLPQLLSLKAFPNAVTWNTSSHQISNMAGPALGGLCVGYLSFEAAYLAAATGALFMFLMITLVRPKPVELDKKRNIPSSALAGVKFIWNSETILAAITLDLFAVLLGGAHALLPIYADQILDVGAVGLGWLRAAPSVGAFVMAILALIVLALCAARGSLTSAPVRAPSKRMSGWEKYGILCPGG